MYIETIRIEHGRVRNIKYHDQRYRATVKAVYGLEPRGSLRTYIEVPADIDTATIKCRISYTDRVQMVEYEPYTVLPRNSLQLVSADHIVYKHKAADRSELTELYALRQACDDILMVKGGLLTDTYYGNVALLSEGKYYTPETPLLRGTMRTFLLEQGTIRLRAIKAADIADYEHLVLFNAMIPFGEVVIPVGNIRS